MASKPVPLPELFDAVKAKFPASVGPERWYLVAASTLVTCSDPFQLGQLYTYLTTQPEYASPERRRFLNKRFREFLMKLWVTIGIPKVATGLFGLIREEQEGDADNSFTKSHVRLDAAAREKGTALLTRLYGPDRTAEYFAVRGAADFEWLDKDVIYGMFYADDSVLDLMETQLITYTAIACQGLPTSAQNHLGGLLRMGLSVEDVELVTQCGELVARWAGHDMKSWPDVRTAAASWK
ncbi:MAG: hypothetical protein ASARMPRED_009310 [Alectoria sarmentosa]|nr:MAG: hypothetical protein ASARMPRED_009310 [Alectoria sarmentosa]